MSKGRRIAQWYKRGKLWIVNPPRWPKDTELSFTERGLMVAWAHNNGYVLRDITPPKGVRYGTPDPRYAR